MRQLGLLAFLALLALGATSAAVAKPAALIPGIASYGASLAAGGEVPRPKAPAGAGGLFSAIVTTDATGSTIAWSLDFNALSGPAAAAHIHLGAPGTAGDPVLTLCGPCTSGVRGEAKLDAKVADALASGNAYVNIHTKANAGGEVRGQIAVAHGLAAGLASTGEVPAAQNVPADAKGAFKAIVIDLPDRAVLAWTLTQSGLSGTAEAAHIHIGKAGAGGPVAIGLCKPCQPTQSGRRTIKPSLATALATGAGYVNVHTAANPGGEIRGQVVHATLGVAAWPTTLGTIVTDDRGMSLYLFAKDQGTQSACYGQCAFFWPPAFAVGTPVVGTGLKAALLTTSSRTDGTTMLAYAGKPLYGFLPDAQPGDTKGQGSKGFGAPWLVIDPATGAQIGGGATRGERLPLRRRSPHSFYRCSSARRSATQSVAYGRTSSRSSGIGRPQTAHRP
jgi:predicted lipoprotein with Yx(FWY)xxD motif